MEPVIEFKGYSIEKLVYTKEDLELEEETEVENGTATRLSIECGVSDDLKDGKVALAIQLKNEGSDIGIILEVSGQFKINNIDDIKEIQRFLSINGTAILYPYVRSIISMVSSLDSSEAIVLPTINTSNFAD